MTAVRMRHPDLPGQHIEVPESAVPHHRAAGWEIDAPPEPEPAPPAAESAPSKRRRAAKEE